MPTPTRPPLDSFIGKTFTPLRPDGSPVGPRYQVTALAEKSARHKGRAAFTVIRLGHDSYAEPVAEEFLATHVEVPEDGAAFVNPKS